MLALDRSPTSLAPPELAEWARFARKLQTRVRWGQPAVLCTDWRVSEMLDRDRFKQRFVGGVLFQKLEQRRQSLLWRAFRQCSLQPGETLVLLSAVE